MTYRHDIHESYNRFLVQHTEESRTSSGLYISRHIGLTNIALEKAGHVGELFVAPGAPGIDGSGFLDNPTGSFDTTTLEEAIPPIVGRVSELGAVASIAIMLYAPDNDPERINPDDKDSMEKFKNMLRIELLKSTAKKPEEGIGNYL